MSDELDSLKGGGIGATVATLLAVLWGWFVRKGEKNEDRLDADRESRLHHLEKRLEGVARDHGQRLRDVELRVENVDTRVKSREGLQGRQHTGVTVLSDDQRKILEGLDE